MQCTMKLLDQFPRQVVIFKKFLVLYVINDLVYPIISYAKNSNYFWFQLMNTWVARYSKGIVHWSE